MTLYTVPISNGERSSFRETGSLESSDTMKRHSDRVVHDQCTELQQPMRRDFDCCTIMLSQWKRVLTSAHFCSRDLRRGRRKFEIRVCSDVNLFKSKLKTFLFKRYMTFIVSSYLFLFSLMERAPSKGRVLWNRKSMFSLSAETYFQSRFLMDVTWFSFGEKCNMAILHCFTSWVNTLIGTSLIATSYSAAFAQAISGLSDWNWLLIA